jgi:hypothetical protein
MRSNDIPRSNRIPVFGTSRGELERIPPWDEWGVALIGKPKALAEPLLVSAEGLVSFDKRGRDLVMVIVGREETNPPPTKARYRFSATLREDAGSIVFHAFALESVDDVDAPEQGIGRAALRAVNLDVIKAKILGAVRAEEEMLGMLHDRNPSLWTTTSRHDELAALLKRFNVDPTPASPAVRPSSDERYRAVALLCVGAYDEGRRRGFDSLVSESFGGPLKTPLKTARDWIYKARLGGWLMPVARGVTHFALGPRFDTEHEGGRDGE